MILIPFSGSNVFNINRIKFCYITNPITLIIFTLVKQDYTKYGKYRQTEKEIELDPIIGTW